MMGEAFFVKILNMIEIKTIINNEELIHKVIELGDKNRKTLGYLPREVFIESASRGLIIGAIDESNHLLGYILFRIVKTKNKISITHFCIDEKAKGKKIPDLMFNKLLIMYENYFNGISLYCRKDYKFASFLWRRLGFKPMFEKRSKSIKENYLVYWWYEFANKNLFTKKFTEDDEQVSVLLDVNIIINLRDDESRHNFECSCLLDDWISNNVDYYYASEIHNELQRDKSKSRQFNTKIFLKSFNQLHLNTTRINEKFNEVHLLLKGVSQNDISDEKQLTEAIVAGIKYFVTLDSWLLENQQLIYNTYYVLVCRPSEFISEFDKIVNYEEYQAGRLNGTEFIDNKMKNNDINLSIQNFLNYSSGEKKSDFELTINKLLADKQNSEIRIIKINNEPIALLGIKFNNGTANVKILRIINFALKDILFRQLIYETIKISLKKNVKVIKISNSIINKNQLILLNSFGFFQKSDLWVKLCYNRTIYSENLFDSFPETSNYLDKDIYTSIIHEVGDKKLHGLYSIERMLWPIKFIDLDIPTYLIPIKPYWASQLFDYYFADELIFGSNAKLMWNRENIYYRNIQPNIEKVPGRILWYASSKDGSSRGSSIIATSYLDEIHIDNAKNIFKRFNSYGIYSWRDINELAQNNANNLIKALKFSDTEVFLNSLNHKDANVICNDIEHKNIFVQSVSKYSNKFFLEVYSRLY